ncbi:MAG: ABC transporter substrate-binding protein, partial [Calditrichaeota bacterium]
MLIAVLLSACSGNSDEHISQQILRVALNDNPTNLDPRTSTDVASFRVIELVYDFLVRMDSTGMPRPDLAERIDTPSDREYIFTLRRGVTFHDGHPLTAYDVAYTFESILDTTLHSNMRIVLQNVRRITVLDSFRVKFELYLPEAPFLSHLQVGIVPRHAVETGRVDLKATPLGSGPFRFVRWSSDAFVELERNDRYWKGAPRLKKIIMKILPEATTRVLALQNGEIDILPSGVPETYLPELEKDSRFKVVKRRGSNYVYLALNYRSPYLASLKVRKAIAHAIDVDAIIKNLLGGLHQRANSLLSPGHWAYNPHLPVYEYDPERARRLLDEAGFPDPDGDGPGTRFSVVYKCTDKLASRQKAQVIQQYLREVGIDVKVQSFEFGTFYDDIQKGRFDLYSLSIVGIYEPAVYRHFFHSRSSRNRVAYHSPEVDRLIELAEHTLDVNKRREYYWRIQEIVQEELPYISLWHETNVAVMDRRLKGFRMYPAGEWRSFAQVYFD